MSRSSTVSSTDVSCDHTENSDLMTLVYAARSLLDTHQRLEISKDDGNQNLDTHRETIAAATASTSSNSGTDLSHRSSSCSSSCDELMKFSSINGSNDSVVSSPPPSKSFVEQLMDLLDDDNFSHVIVWMPDGMSFTFRDAKRFAAVEMPTMFRIKNMSSFVRKLTRWGFTRGFDRETMNSDIFQHKDFIKGQKQRAIDNIKCSAGRPSTSTLAARAKAMKEAAAAAAISVSSAVSTPPPVTSAAAKSQSFINLSALSKPKTSHNIRHVSVSDADDTAVAKSSPARRSAAPAPVDTETTQQEMHRRRVSIGDLSRDVATLSPVNACSSFAARVPLWDHHTVTSASSILRNPSVPVSSISCGNLNAGIVSLLRGRQSTMFGSDTNASRALATLIHEQDRLRQIQIEQLDRMEIIQRHLRQELVAKIMSSSSSSPSMSSLLPTVPTSSHVQFRQGY